MSLSGTAAIREARRRDGPRGCALLERLRQGADGSPTRQPLEDGSARSARDHCRRTEATGQERHKLRGGLCPCAARKGLTQKSAAPARRPLDCRVRLRTEGKMVDFTKNKKGDVVAAHCCDSCARAAGLTPKTPAGSGKASWFCEVCGHHGMGSLTDCEIGDWLRLRPMQPNAKLTCPPRAGHRSNDENKD